MDENFERSVRRQLRALKLCTACAAAIATLSLLGAVAAVRSASFDILTVHRINVVDASGTLRLAIFNKDTEPDPIIGGKPMKGRKGPKRSGFLFYNDIGDEQGGLFFNGQIINGRVRQGGLLSFDPWRQNDNVDLYFSQDGKSVEEGLALSQTDPRPLSYFVPRYQTIMKMPPGPLRAAALAKLRRDGLSPRNRLFAGIAGDNRSQIVLSDRQGRARMRMQVTPDGLASIETLDESGNVTASFPAK
jgi:hypothetical protein